MTITLENVVPADGSLLALNQSLTFTASTDLGVLQVSVYIIAHDADEIVYDGAAFVGRYVLASTKAGDDFVVVRRGGWPSGGASLKVREFGVGTVKSVSIETTNGFAGTVTDPTGDASIALGTDVVGLLKGDGTGVSAAVPGTDYLDEISDASVTNAKLADVGTATLKGRTTAGTGAPEDLTSAQATALLATLIGDSGSGGTKGLVPAPSAGDAAADKFLKANGSWEAAGGGNPLDRYSVMPFGGISYPASPLTQDVFTSGYSTFSVEPGYYFLDLLMINSPSTSAVTSSFSFNPTVGNASRVHVEFVSTALTLGAGGTLNNRYSTTISNPGFPATVTLIGSSNLTKVMRGSGFLYFAAACTFRPIILHSSNPTPSAQLYAHLRLTNISDLKTAGVS